VQILDQVSWANFNDDILSFYKAIGVDLVHFDIRAGGKTSTTASPLGGDVKAGKDCTAAFEEIRDKVESHGLKLNNVFMPAWEEITLGLPDMDEKIDAWGRMLESLGRAGVPNLGWNFKPMGNFRTPSDIGRGGVKYSSFDYEAIMQNRPASH
jgi:hypothetical protein